MQVSDSVTTSANQELDQPNSSATQQRDHYIDVENKLRYKRRRFVLDKEKLQIDLRLSSIRKLIRGRHGTGEAFVDPPSAMQHVYFDAALPLLLLKDADI